MTPRVLLIWPGTDGAAAGNFGCPQLVTMATYVRERTGAHVEIIDLYAERAFGPVDLSRVFGGPDGKGYDVIGFSCYSSFDFLKIEAVAQVARTICPDAVLCAGGYHTSARPTDFVYDGSPFDVAVVGEGERPLVKIVESVKGGAPLRNQILGSDPIEDLEELPPTDWSFLNRYRPIAKRIASQVQVYLSRGCPFDCAFCMERAKREVSWRAYSVDRALDELDRAHAFFDLTGMTVYFADALFGMRKKWRREFLQRLPAKAIPARKFWLLVRVDMIDDEDLDLFGGANCSLGFGLESGDPKHLATIRKAGRLEDYLDRMKYIAARAREKDVPWGANVIVGHPGETEATLRTSAAYLRDLFLDPAGTTGFLSVDPFRLYPGSPIDDERSAWEERFGTRFHRAEWWKDGDQEFLAEWVDPSGDLDYRRRTQLSHELLAPVLRGIRDNYVLGGSARDYFERAIDEQVENLSPRYRLHYAGRYYAWKRYLGKGKAARDELALDDDTLTLCRDLRASLLPRIAERVFPDAGARAAFADSEIGKALVKVPRERFVPIDQVTESGYDVAIGLDASGLATVSAMHAYARSFTLAGIGAGARVLDLGGGTGYGAAILAEVVGSTGKVVTVEVDPKLAETATTLVPEEVIVLSGDGLSPALLERAVELAEGRFDAVVAGFAFPDGVPQALGAVLRAGGVVVAPVASDGGQRLCRAEWDGERFVTAVFEEVYYVPYRDKAANEPARAELKQASAEPQNEPKRTKRLKVLQSEPR
ncbi:MAG: radical SAM protein [Polyangiaceae bacterium]|nr:radical SAM protein [Polyangiaceae bacterium]